MPFDNTVLVRSARILDGAWIHAESVDAGAFWGTLAVVGALLFVTSHVGISRESGRAGAGRLVGHATADGVATTGKSVNATYGRAVTSAAGVSLGALAIGSTTHWDALDLRVAVEARLDEEEAS